MEMWCLRVEVWICVFCHCIFLLFWPVATSFLPFVFVPARRCCTTLAVEDSQRESMRLDGVDEQAIPRPLPHDELVQLLSGAAQAWVAADLARQGYDLARAA